MQVFKSYDGPKEGVKKSSREAPVDPDSRIKKTKERRGQLSEREIRAKIAEHDKDPSVSSMIRSKKKSEIKPEASEVTTEEGTIPGNFSNNPKDPVTQEKLKDMLSSGAIKFSQKERDVLSSILK